MDAKYFQFKHELLLQHAKMIVRTKEAEQAFMVCKQEESAIANAITMLGRASKLISDLVERFDPGTGKASFVNRLNHNFTEPEVQLWATELADRLGYQLVLEVRENKEIFASLFFKHESMEMTSTPVGLF